MDYLNQFIGYQATYVAILKVKKYEKNRIIKKYSSKYKVIQANDIIVILITYDEREIGKNLLNFQSWVENEVCYSYNAEKQLYDITDTLKNELKSFYEVDMNGKVFKLNKYSELVNYKDTDELNPDQLLDGQLNNFFGIHIEDKLKKYDSLVTTILEELSNYYKDIFKFYKILNNIIETAIDKVTDTLPVTNKIETTFTVPQISLLFRLLTDERKLKPKSKSDLYRLVAKSFASKKNENMSVSSIKNNFESPDPNAKRELEGLLMNMRDRLNRMH